MRFTSGYNLLLRKEDIPEGFQKMSMIQLLRNMNVILMKLLILAMMKMIWNV